MTNRLRDYGVLALLLIVSTFMMVNHNEPMLRSLRVVALNVTARVEGQFAWAARYLNALQENDALRTTNIELSSQFARLRQAQLENERLQDLLDLRDSTAFATLATRIVDKDITGQYNTFTIDVGRADGVREGLPVIDERGILGKVILVADHYTLVQSYLNQDFSVPAQVLPSQTFGIVSWDGIQTDRLRLSHIVRTQTITRGQPVVTYSSLSFPEGLAIGRIDSVEVQPGQNELVIYLAPASPISQAEHAFVLLYTPDSTRAALSEQP